jgi:hypothetical protein
LEYGLNTNYTSSWYLVRGAPLLEPGSDLVTKNIPGEGLKGITIYVDGSRSGVLISNEDKDKKDDFKENHAPRRTKIMDCDVHRSIIDGQDWMVFVSHPYFRQIRDGKSALRVAFNPACP